MARVKLSDEIKKAISLLPPREKDKLLFRLIAKDPSLVQRLEFELLEGGETKDARREDLQTHIESTLENYRPHYYSPGYLLLVIRDLSGEINRHVSATKDKYGEVELNFLMLNKSLELFGEELRRASPHRSRTFNIYVVKRALKLLNLLSKMHSDLHLDFQPSMKELGGHIGNQPNMMKIAIMNMLDVNWLLRSEVP